jgi:hypothetical protein
MKAPETVDAVQWDGLMATALAFFGMDVLKDRSECCFLFTSNGLFQKDDCNCPDCTYDGGHPDRLVPLSDWILRDEIGNVWTMTDKQFNNEYDIIDEYPA